MPAKKTLQQREQELQALLAYSNRPEGTPATGIPLSGSKRQVEASQNIRYHLHSRP